MTFQQYYLLLGMMDGNALQSLSSQFLAYAAAAANSQPAASCILSLLLATVYNLVTQIPFFESESENYQQLQRGANEVVDPNLPLVTIQFQKHNSFSSFFHAFLEEDAGEKGEQRERASTQSQ